MNYFKFFIYINLYNHSKIYTTKKDWQQLQPKLQKDLFHHLKHGFFLRQHNPNGSQVNIWKEAGTATHTNVEKLRNKGSKRSSPTRFLFQENQFYIPWTVIIVIFAPCKGILPFPLQTGNHLCSVFILSMH